MKPNYPSNEYQSIYDAEMRRRKLQEAMFQQAMAPQETQYAGNRAVPYSPLQGLTTLGQALIARSAMDSGDRRLAEARKSQEDKKAKLIETVMKTMRGTPEIPAVTADKFGPPQFPDEQQVITPAIPAVPPNPQEAMVLAASQPETAEMAKYIGLSEKAKAKGGDSFAKINPKDFTPDSVRRFERTGNYDDLISVKQLNEHAKDFNTVQAAETRTDQALKKIDYILDPKNKHGFERNFGGYNALITSQYPDAQDMKVKIESLKSDLKMAGLEMIRAGGSIGQMTEREWPIVQNLIDSIDPKMGETAARDAFNNIKTYLDNIRNNARETYKTNWSGTQFYKPTKQIPKENSKKEAPTVLKFDAQGNQIK